MMSGNTKPWPETLVVDMTDFPSAAERARQEGDFVPAAGFALVPPGSRAHRRSRLWIPLALLAAAGAGAYHILGRARSSATTDKIGDR
jgi:hypothetical protein